MYDCHRQSLEFQFAARCTALPKPNGTEQNRAPLRPSDHRIRFRNLIGLGRVKTLPYGIILLIGQTNEEKAQAVACLCFRS